MSSKKGGSKKKKRAPSNSLLPEALSKFLVDRNVEQFRGFNFVDTHCHFEWLFTGLVPSHLQDSEDKLKLLKDSLFTEKEDVRKKIFQHFNFVVQIYCYPESISPKTTLYKELCAEDADFGNYCAFGIHPHKADCYNEEVEKDLLNCLEHERCVAFGEIGLDFFRNNSERDVQIKVFRRQLELSKKVGKPIIIHSRDSEKETVEILKEIVERDTKIHVHCYTSTNSQFAKDLLHNFPNCYIGFTGVLTKPSYCNLEEIKELMDWIPINRILLESDGPFMMIRNKKYLKRGKYGSTCCNIPFIGEKVAEMKKMDFGEVMEQIFINSKEMYEVDKL